MDADERAARASLIDDLKATLGAKLLAVYAFGSELGRGKGAGHPRVLVVLDALKQATLDTIAPRLNDARIAGVRVRVDSADALLRGADAFPAFALELRDHRELLAGRDVLVDLELSHTHLRLHVEQGLRSMHRELVQSYLERGARGDDVVALRRTTRRLVYLFKAALLLVDQAASEDATTDTIIDAVSAAILGDHDPAPWEVLKGFARGEGKLRGDDAQAFYGALLSALPVAIRAIDTLPEGS